MFNVTKWFKDGFEFPENGENLINNVVDMFKNNEQIIDRAAMSVKFKNGAQLLVRMADKVIKAAADAPTEE